MQGPCVTTIAATFFLCGLVGVATQSSMHSGNRIVLSVKKNTDPAKVLPKSALYTAELSNANNEPVTLEAVQMPGGYVGSGQFFPCSLERWSAKDGKWTPLRQARLSTFGHDPHLVSVSIKPDESIQVCDLMLPSQAGVLGDCVRFSLQTRWRDDASEAFVSKPFLIDEGQELRSGSCEFRHSSDVTGKSSTESLIHESGHVDPSKQH